MRKLDSTLIRVIDAQLHAIREIMRSTGSIEILPPYLLRGATNPAELSFQVQAGSFSGVLARAGTAAVTAANCAVGPAHIIMTAFRPDDFAEPNHIIEFHYLFAQWPGQHEDAIELAERILQRCIKAAGDLLGANAPAHLKHLTFPIRRIRYEEAIKIANRTYGDDIRQTDALAICKHFDNQLVIFTDIPRAVRAHEFDFKLSDEITRSFEIIGPFAGEICGGGEIETNKKQLHSQMVHHFNQVLASAEDAPLSSFDPWMENLAALKSPYVMFSLGVERLTQFLTGRMGAFDAVAFPNPATEGTTELQLLENGPAH